MKIDGYKCPQCGNSDHFRVLATALMDVSGDSLQLADHTTPEWEEDSYMECPSCLTYGEAGIFMVTNQKAEVPPLPTVVQRVDGVLQVYIGFSNQDEANVWAAINLTGEWEPAKVRIQGVTTTT